MLEPPDKLARELRAATLASDHDRAARLTVEYTEALREYWLALSPEERAVSDVPKRSLDLLNWVREMALLQQALTATHLAAVEKASRNQSARAVYASTAELV
jgi:hypothetical protein